MTNPYIPTDYVYDAPAIDQDTANGLLLAFNNMIAQQLTINSQLSAILANQSALLQRVQALETNGTGGGGGTGGAPPGTGFGGKYKPDDLEGITALGIVLDKVANVAAAQDALGLSTFVQANSDLATLDTTNGTYKPRVTVPSTRRVMYVDPTVLASDSRPGDLVIVG